MVGLRPCPPWSACCSGRRTTGRAGSRSPSSPSPPSPTISTAMWRAPSRSNRRSGACSTPSPTSFWWLRRLLMLVADGTIKGWALWAAIVILCREILVSGLREFLAELKVSVPVSRVAKWKTTLQLVALGFLIAGPAGETVLPDTIPIGIGPVVDRRHPDDLYRLGLSQDRHPPPGGRGLEPMKLVYFAWVRERIGRTDEEVDPAGGDRHGCRPGALAQGARRGIRLCLRERGRRPGRHRPCPCQARCAASPALARSPSSPR